MAEGDGHEERGREVERKRKKKGELINTRKPIPQAEQTPSGPLPIPPPLFLSFFPFILMVLQCLLLSAPYGRKFYPCTAVVWSLWVPH